MLSHYSITNFYRGANRRSPLSPHSSNTLDSHAHAKRARTRMCVD